MEVDLGRDDVGADVALAVNHGHGRLVAGGLDREDQRRSGGKTVAHLVAPIADGRRPRTDRSPRLRSLPHQALVGLQGQVGPHDERVLALAIVAWATADLGEAEYRVERDRGVVTGPDLKRHGSRAQHLGVVGHARDQAARGAGATVPIVHGHVVDLEIGPRERAARVADHAALVMRDPPGAAGLRELLEEGLALPGGVNAVREDARLECRHGVEIVHGHRAQL